MPTRHFKNYLHLLKEAFDMFKDNHPVKFASAIAYFSLFALPCIFLVIIHALGLLFDRNTIENELREQLADVVGEDGAAILVKITINYGEQAGESIWYLLLYIVIVFWLSTQLFRLFQNSLNDLWQIKPDIQSFWQKMWVERGKTFVLVLATGLMFYASFGIKQLLQFTTSDVLGTSGINDTLLQAIVVSFTVVLVFFWFALLYKEVPAVNIKWGPTFVGAAMTTILFFAGFWLLWNFVVLRDLEQLYAEVTPIIRVALWVFYSSLVFLYGASLTRAYARYKHKSIKPASYAYKYAQVREGRSGEDEVEI